MKKIIKRLLQLKATLESELAQLHQSAQPVMLDQQSVGRVSRIDAIQQQQMAQSNKLLVIKRLREITRALQRANEDKYGRCEECNETILKARLAIKPEARYCIECQASHD